MSLDQRVQQLENQVRELRQAQRDFLTTRIEERDLRIDGVLSVRGTRILSGTGAPAMNAPTGSIYLRADGTNGNTLYVRENNVWRRVSGTAA
jgi:hypothetical protein